MVAMWKTIGSLALVFYQLIDRVLSKLEHAEFVTQHLPWLARMMEWTRQMFEAPDWTVAYAIPITGLGLLCWLYWPQMRQRFRKPKPVEPQSKRAIVEQASIAPSSLSIS